MAVPALLAISAVGRAASIIEGRKSRKESRRANKAQENARRLESRRASIEQARAAQKARARSLQQSANQGAGESSFAEGAVSSIEQQGLSNISFLDQVEGFNRSAFKHSVRATRAAGNSQDLTRLSKLALFAATELDK